MIRRIVLCQDQTNPVDSLAMLLTSYFDTSKHRLIRLRLKSHEELPEALVAGTKTKKSLHRYTTSTQKAGRAFREYEATYQDIYREAQFSDMLIIKDIHYREYCHQKFVQSLSLLHCPILVVPLCEERIEQIILIDDGHPNTYQQIKHIASLFPELCLVIPTTLLIVHDNHNDSSARKEKLWIEYLKLHFAHLAVQRVEEHNLNTLPLTIDYSRNALLIGSTHLKQLRNALSPLKQFRIFSDFIANIS